MKTGRRTPISLGPPAFLWVPALFVAVAMLLAPVYLVIRTASAGQDALSLFLRERTALVLVRTVALAISVTAATSAIAIPLAWLTVRTDLPLRKLWSVLTILPLVIPSYVGGFVLVAAFGPRGMLQHFLSGPFGIERLPEIYGFPGALLALTLFSYPYMLLNVRAALAGMDPALEEASLSLGQGPRATFFHVTLQHLRPAAASGALLVALYTLSDFGAVSLLQFDSFTRQIYVQYQGSFDRTLAAVFSLVLVALTITVLFAEGRVRGKLRYYRSGVGTGRPPMIVSLGRWKWPALCFCGSIVLFSLLIPVAILGFWLVQGLLASIPLQAVWAAALHSAMASGLAAIITVTMALPVAILAVRYSGRLSSLLERISYTGFALPGIVIALSLVFFGIRFATPFYQTLGMLVFAYMVLFLPQAVGSVRSSVMQISPRLEEAARSLGHSPPSVLARITLPLIRNGLLGGAALVFLTVMKELPATLVLSPIGFDTLATEVWNATTEGLFAQAAVPALLLIAVSSGAIVLLLLQEKRAGKTAP
ncbi:MAG: iron ABC transporter permease [Dehalococcoidia bacterium]|nr:iron ABC transporter permease [Dehalococcoidia bacterium]